MTPNCGNYLYARGLCPTCYEQARRLVKKGLKTWNDLEALGLCKPKIVGNRKPLMPFMEAYNKTTGTENGD